MELKLFTEPDRRPRQGGRRAEGHRQPAQSGAGGDAPDETYHLIDTTLNMVIIRLGDILLLAAADDFLREAARLDNYNEWMQAEREFRQPTKSRRTQWA